MYKVIVIDEDGKESVTENVIDYNFIDVDFCQDIAESDFDTELSDDELKEVQKYCQDCERLPDSYDMNMIIEQIIKDRS